MLYWRCILKGGMSVKKEKTPKKKPSHSVPSNAWWTFQRLWEYAPGALAVFVALIPLRLASRYLEIVFPSKVLEVVTAALPFGAALRPVGILLVLLFAAELGTRILADLSETVPDPYRNRLRNWILRKHFALLYEDYEKKDVRDLADRASGAVQMWNGIVPVLDMFKSVLRLVESVCGYLLFGTVIVFASPWLVPILTVSPAVNWLAGRAYNRWDHAHREKMSDLETKQACVRKLPDDFKSAKDIRIYSMADWIRETYRDLTGQLAAENRKRIRRSFLSRIADLFVILLRDGGAYALLISMFLQGKIDTAQFVLYFAAVSSFASWIGGIVSAWNQMHASSLSICFLRDYLELPEKDGTGEASAEDVIGSAPEIVFDHVSFRYDGAEDFTIRNLSLTIKSGEKLALVGLNGAGKTTLVKLLCGLYHPTSGEIRVNGIAQSQFRRKDYYTMIAPVFQDVRTAFYSLAETVSCRDWEHTDRMKVETALKRAGLWEKIETLPDGMDTKLDKKVNKDGTELSGGEAQKLMLARALYKDAPILVLDEPTAALDPIAEARLYGEYGRMTEGKTSLFVSHRLATTAFCDRVILLENGRIAEEGTHAELMRLGGKYRELYEIQSQWYQENREGAIA